MNVAELRTILEHLPDDLTIRIAGHGVLCSVRRLNGPWTTAGLYLDVRGPRLKGVFRDRRTLDVRLEGLAS